MIGNSGSFPLLVAGMPRHITCNHTPIYMLDMNHVCISCIEIYCTYYLFCRFVVFAGKKNKIKKVSYARCYPRKKVK